MTETEFLALLSEIRPAASSMGPWVPDLAFADSPFDSLDLLEIRAALETRLGVRLTDERFIASTSLRDLFELVKHV